MLTGPAIREAVKKSEIKIDPYKPEHIGPNSYDVTLADEIITYVIQPYLISDHTDWSAFDVPTYLDECGTVKPIPRLLDPRVANPTDKKLIGTAGALLLPGTLYLGRTVERIHSNTYSSTIHGRSSVGRLGVVVHQTAAFIDVGFDGVVTLEITVTHPVRLYAGMRIAQIAFHPLVGEIELYKGKYQGASDVQASRLHMDADGGRTD